MSGLTYTLDNKTTLQLRFSIAKPTNKSRLENQYNQVCSMLHKHLDVLATCILPSQIIDHPKGPMAAILM